jgi:hypothetical protein
MKKFGDDNKETQRRKFKKNQRRKFKKRETPKTLTRDFSATKK